MEYQEIVNEYRIVGITLKHEGKVHCGDCLSFSEIASEQLVLLTISDGVGSLHHDWVASQIACDSFIESFTNSTIKDKLARFENALQEADRAVSDPSDSVMKGMMCTFIAVVWDKKKNDFLYCSIGDSRIYGHSVNSLKQISTDEKKAVNMRDKGGKLLNQSGVLIVREGLTNALGYSGAKINIVSESFNVGDALVLCSDGMYDVPNFSDEIIEILQNSDLKKAIEKFTRKNREMFNDDASILILQRTLVPDEIMNQIRVGINENTTCSELNIPVHLVTTWIMDEFRKLISQRDSSGLEKMTEYVTKNELKLSESFVENSINEMKTIVFFNALFYQMLIVQLKKLRW
jgi:serine/threonine protein phosphatase PrpC